MPRSPASDWKDEAELSAHAKMEKKESTMVARRRFKDQQKEIAKLRKKKEVGALTLNTNLPYYPTGTKPLGAKDVKSEKKKKKRKNRKNTEEESKHAKKLWRRASVKLLSAVRFAKASSSKKGEQLVKFDGRSARPALAQLSPQHMPLVSPVMPDNITQQRRDKIFDITYERKQLWRSHNFAEELERERLELIKKAQLKYSSGGIGHTLESTELEEKRASLEAKKRLSLLREEVDEGDYSSKDHVPTPKLDKVDLIASMKKSKGPSIFERMMSQLDTVAVEDEVPSKITSYIYLGDKLDARNKQRLQEVGITHIINCAIKQMDSEFPHDFTYLEVAVLDREDQDLKAHFKRCNAFLRKCVAKKKKVLVHCRAGYSRSPGIVIAYLMAEEGMRLWQAQELVESKRLVMPNDAFRLQLARYELELFGESSVCDKKGRWWDFYEWNAERTQYPRWIPDRGDGACVLL